MSKKIILASVIFVFFFGFNLAHADVVINEVQLLPTSGRFIELYNTGDGVVDLTNWLMQRKIATGDTFGSLVPSSNFQSKTIGAHGYFLISRTQLSNSNIVFGTLTLTESNTIQIKISGASEVIDKIGWGSVTDCINPCPPNPAEGQSLQRTVSGSWVAATPTPGITNETVVLPSPLPEPDSGTSEIVSSGGGGSGSSAPSGSVSTETKNKIVEAPTIKTKISTKTLVFATLPNEFTVSATGYSGEPLSLLYGKYFINFGDGDSKEIKAGDINYLQKFYHTYFYEGVYVATLEYYKNSYSDIPDAYDKITIKVVPVNILISTVGDEKDFFVELTNNGSVDMDLSKWTLASISKSFILPKNTVIPSKGKIIISSKVTNFSIEDKNTLKLMNPQGEIVSDYLASIVVPKITPKIVSPISSLILPLNKEAIPKTEEVYSETEIPTNNLGASAVSSDVIPEKSSLPYLPAMISFVFIGTSAGAVYFIRGRKVLSKMGSDFDILDE